jgi:hypothetical protein
MKRKLVWVLVAAVLVAAVVIMMSPGKPAPRGHIEMTHLGFTNSPTGPEAIFAVHFPPRISSSSWKYVEVDRWEEGGWKPWNPGTSRPGMQHLVPQSRTSLPNGRQVDLFAHYRLSNTNDSWRVRTHIDEGPLRPFRSSFFIELWRKLGNRLRGGQSKILIEPEYSYWVTNEVHPGASAR